MLSSMLLSLALAMSLTGDSGGGGDVILVLVEHTVDSSSWTGGSDFFSVKHCLGGMLILRIPATN